MADINLVELPAIFNVATHFVDRHIHEGRGERIAYECGDEHVSYRQLFERVNRAGNALKKLDVRQEERVVLLLFDTPEFPFCFFGAIKIHSPARRNANLQILETPARFLASCS